MKRSRLRGILGVVLALTLFLPVASGHAGAGEGGAALSAHFDAYHHDEGGPDDDVQVTLGTADKEFFLEEGNEGTDTQYVSADAHDDWTIQRGGEGDDTATARIGYGNDTILQDGGGTTIPSLPRALMGTTGSISRVQRAMTT